jgi:hypothetical protein
MRQGNSPNNTPPKLKVVTANRRFSGAVQSYILYSSERARVASDATARVCLVSKGFLDLLMIFKNIPIVLTNVQDGLFLLYTEFELLSSQLDALLR